MKIALQNTLIPVETNKDKAKWAKDHGADAIELSATKIETMKQQADDMIGTLPISTVCGNSYNGQWDGSFEFLNPDIKKRRQSIDAARDILKFCGQVGALGQIVVPIFGGPVVPDLSPFKTPLEIEDELCAAMLRELGAWAVENKVQVFLEALNRYEMHYLRKQTDSVRLIKKADAKGLMILSDFFHMHIEETNTPAAFKEVGPHIGAVHLADNTRMEPGTGDIDFVAGFKALKAVGFKNYMAYECSISGETKDEKAKNLAKSLDHVRACLAKAS